LVSRAVVRLCPAYLGLATLLCVSLHAGPHHLSNSAAEDIFEHVLAFGLLTTWLTKFHAFRYRGVIVPACLCVFGCGLEALQQRLGGYHRIEWDDLVASNVGIIAGGTLASLASARLSRLSLVRQEPPHNAPLGKS
jgi:hypothetical protein